MKTARGRFPVGGFSLIEVVLALGLVGFCVVSLLGLFSVGLQSNTASSSETVVASLLTAIASDLAATPTTAQTSPQFKIPVPAGGSVTNTLFFSSDGSLAGAIDTDATPSTNPRYRAMIVVIPPTAAEGRGATAVRIFLTWPALADPSVSSVPTHYAGSVETMAAFLRN